MNIVKRYEDLPVPVQKKLEVANVFYTKGYAQYLMISGAKAWYVFDESQIVVAEVMKKVGIEYAIMPSEPFVWGEESDQKKFLEEAMICLKKEGVAWVLTSASAFFNTYPDDSLRIPFGSHVIDLELSEEELWKKVHSKHRNSVRRAEKGEVYVRNGGIELLDDYMVLDEATWARSDRASYGKSFFTKMIEAMGDNIKVCIAYRENVPQAGAVFYVNNAMSYYMYGASSDSPEPGATNFLHWEAIKARKEEGVKKYSFVGCRIGEDESSKYHTIQRFKERFGGELIQGYTFKAILHPLKYKFFCTLYEMKKKTKYADVVDQEIGKWRELNS